MRLSSAVFDPVLILQPPGGDTSDWLVDNDGGGGTDAMIELRAEQLTGWLLVVTADDVAGGDYRQGNRIAPCGPGAWPCESLSACG